MAASKAEELYHLLLMRGNVALSALKEIHRMTGELIAAYDKVDEEWRVPVQADDTNRALIDAMRKTYPQFADATDAEIIAMLNLTASQQTK